jgi:hypothetical protein
MVVERLDLFDAVLVLERVVFEADGILACGHARVIRLNSNGKGQNKAKNDKLHFRTK